MDNCELAEKAYWHNYWNDITLPLEIKKSKNRYINEILNIFDEYLSINDHMSKLEIGGSPGQYLAYMHKHFGYDIHCLDYSNIGCVKTKKNFNLLNIHGNVYLKDLFSEDLALRLFDIVYSLGFIEHFSGLNIVVEIHLKLLRPGGILIIGCPNLLGINYWFLKRLSPERLSIHNLFSMNHCCPVNYSIISRSWGFTMPSTCNFEKNY